jgi:hypothetical protein
VKNDSNFDSGGEMIWCLYQEEKNNNSSVYIHTKRVYTNATFLVKGRFVKETFFTAWANELL